MTRLMGMESTCILMDLATKVTGRKTSSMDLEEKSGQMELLSKESMWMERNMEKAPLLGLMGVSTMESSSTITFMEKGFISGQMVDTMKENG